MAAASGDQDSDGVVRYIMEARGVNFTLKNNEYLHAFSCAATKGNFNILETMLEYVEAGSKNIEIALMYHGKQMQTVSDEEIDSLTQHIEAEKKKNQSQSQANR